MTWDHGNDELTRFINHLNTSNKYIRFTSEISVSELNFLGVKTRLADKQLTTDLYMKLTENKFKQDETFQIELRHRFSILIDITSVDLPEIDNVVNLSDRPLTELNHKAIQKKLPLEAMLKTYNKYRRSLLQTEENDSNVK